MATHTLAGQPAPAGLLIDVSELQKAYYERRPDPGDPRQRVAFGTSGHRGTPLDGTFTEAHILAITRAICDYRRDRGIDGPLFLGKDTHALSGPAQRTALEVLAAEGVVTILQRDDGVTPSSRWSTASTPLAASTSSAVRWAGPERAWVSFPRNRGPSIPRDRR